MQVVALHYHCAFDHRASGRELERFELLGRGLADLDLIDELVLVEAQLSQGRRGAAAGAVRTFKNGADRDRSGGRQ